MPHIIRDAEFKTSLGKALCPGMWVHTWGWGRKHMKPTPIDGYYLWRVEQHDGVMLLAGQGVDVLVPLTPELADECILIENPACELLAAYPNECAALHKLGWGVYLHYFDGAYTSDLHNRLALHYQRGNKAGNFFLPDNLRYQVERQPEVIRTFLVTSYWRLKHPRYANALLSQQQREFFHWPNAPDLKQLHAMGLAAWKTQEGNIEISPDGKLTATGRKALEFPELENDEPAE
jgi:hypothetical protein